MLKIEQLFSYATWPLLFMASTTFAAVEPALTTTTPKLQEVTVYSNQALMVFTGRLKLAPGIQSFVVPEVPQSLDETSLRFKLLRGSAAITDLKVNTDYTTRYLDERRRVVDETIDDLLAEKSKLHGRLRTLLKQYESLQQVAVIPPEGAGGQPTFPLHAEQWPKLTGFLEKNLRRLLDKRRNLLKQIKELDDELSKLQLKQQQWQGQRVAAQKSIGIRLESDTIQNIHYELRYVMTDASWFPLYDLRVDSDRARAELTSFAWVTQNSGHDWDDVDVTFSSAIPSFDFNLPKWRSQVISERAPQPRRSVALNRKQEKKLDETMALSEQTSQDAPAKAKYARRKSSRLDADGIATPPRGDLKSFSNKDALLKSEERAGGGQRARSTLKNTPTDKASHWWYQNPFDFLKLPVFHAAAIAPPTMHIDRYPPHSSAGGFDYRYKALRRENLPSSAVGKRVPMLETALPIELYRRIHASSSEHAFIEGKIRNSQKTPLLAGTVHLYLDGAYVGRDRLPTLASGSYGAIPLGVDRNMKIKRIHTVKRQKKGIIFSDHYTNHDVTIKIANLRKQSVELYIEEEIPHTRQKDVKISLGDVAPKPKTMPKLAKGKTRMNWQFRLGATKEGEVKFNYSITHPTKIYVNHEAIP